MLPAETLTIGYYLQDILWYFGGVAGITTMYFIVMIYVQWKNYQENKEERKILKSIQRDIRKLRKVKDDTVRM